MAMIAPPPTEGGEGGCGPAGWEGPFFAEGRVQYHSLHRGSRSLPSAEGMVLGACSRDRVGFPGQNDAPGGLQWAHQKYSFRDPAGGLFGRLHRMGKPDAVIYGISCFP